MVLDWHAHGLHAPAGRTVKVDGAEETDFVVLFEFGDAKRASAELILDHVKWEIAIREVDHLRRPT